MAGEAFNLGIWTETLLFQGLLYLVTTEVGSDPTNCPILTSDLLCPSEESRPNPQWFTSVPGLLSLNRPLLESRKSLTPTRS